VVVAAVVAVMSVQPTSEKVTLSHWPSAMADVAAKSASADREYFRFILKLLWVTFLLIDASIKTKQSRHSKPFGV
jgi:hypothetical protein